MRLQLPVMTVVAGMLVLPDRDWMKMPDVGGVVAGAADVAAVEDVAGEGHGPVAAELDRVGGGAGAERAGERDASCR